MKMHQKRNRERGVPEEIVTVVFVAINGEASPGEKKEKEEEEEQRRDLPLRHPRLNCNQNPLSLSLA